jgi:hypothetical protein
MRKRDFLAGVVAGTASLLVTHEGCTSRTRDAQSGQSHEQPCCGLTYAIWV